jgi:hypothetical protein
MEATTLISVINALPASMSVLIRGSHGIGKSQIVAAIAKAQGKDLIDVRASTMQEGDVVGYPDLEAIKSTGVSTFAPPAWFVSACKEPKILFLDELNRGLVGVLNGMFQIVLDRELGNGPDGKPMRLHPETQVIAAVNSGNEYTVNEMDPALLDRFWVADFKPSVQDWLTWAKEFGVSMVVTDFIQHHPEHLRPTKEVEPGKVVPSQRSWERLDRSLRHAGVELDQVAGVSHPILYPMATGFVGTEAAIAFENYVKTLQNMITAEDVIDRWSKFESKVAALSTDKQLALIEKVKTAVAKEDLKQKQIDNLVSFWRTLTGELQMALFNGVLGCGNNANLVKFHKQVGQDILGVITKAQAAGSKK